MLVARYIGIAPERVSRLMRYGLLRYGLRSSGLLWYGVLWYGLLWYGLLRKQYIDACYDTSGSSSWRKRFLSDGALQPKIVGMFNPSSFCCNIFRCVLEVWDGSYRAALSFSFKSVLGFVFG